jgi:excisionase family DNA binding protein
MLPRADERRRGYGDRRSWGTTWFLGEAVRGVILLEERRSNGDSYTPTEAALVLGVTPTRVRQLLQEGELEGKRDGAGHWWIPARALHDRLERLRRERFVEAVGADPLSVHMLQRQVEALLRELGRLEGLLESEERAFSSLEADRALLAQRLEHERRRAEQERARAEWLRAELEKERNKGFWRKLSG